MLLTIGSTVLGWSVVLGTMYLAMELPRLVFLPVYYSTHIGVFGVMTYALRKMGVKYTAWVFAVVVASTLVSLEIFYWVFVYPESAAAFALVADWLIPLVFVFMSVYLTALFTRT